MSHMHTDRLQELLVDEALAALDAEHSTELETLLGDCPATQRDALMQAAAFTQLAFLRRDRSALQPMPERLKARLRGAAQRFAAGPG